MSPEPVLKASDPSAPRTSSSADPVAPSILVPIGTVTSNEGFRPNEKPQPRFDRCSIVTR